MHAHTPAALARLRADLAAALQRRETLQRRWAAATYTGSSTDDPADLDVALARLDATVAELEESLSAASEGAAPAVAAPSPSPPAVAPPEYLTTRQAAALLGVSGKLLEALRARGKGPPFVRVGHAVRYPRSTLALPK